MVMFPRNDPHHLFTKQGLEPADISGYVSLGTNGAVNSISMDFGGEEANCYCGWIGVLSGSHPLLDALPSMLLIDRDAFASDWVASSLRVAAGEWHSSPTMVAKISELLFVQAVRRYVEDLGEERHGWLAALRDPTVARALAMIHARYAQDLNIGTLAHEAGVSKTVLGERFVELIGEPPMRYCARWRMRVAANRLLEGQDTTATIAHSVGFGSEAAFNRAFKREYGDPPGVWKRNADEQARATQNIQAAA